jgi:hypothetical protein
LKVRISIQNQRLSKALNQLFGSNNFEPPPLPSNSPHTKKQSQICQKDRNALCGRAEEENLKDEDNMKPKSQCIEKRMREQVKGDEMKVP